jgi:hypothetical protein
MGLSNMICDAMRNPLAGDGSTVGRKSGASTSMDVIGMAWVIPVAAIRASRSLRGSRTCSAAQQSAKPYRPSTPSERLPERYGSRAAAHAATLASALPVFALRNSDTTFVSSMNIMSDRLNGLVCPNEWLEENIGCFCIS